MKPNRHLFRWTQFTLMGLLFPLVAQFGPTAAVAEREQLPVVEHRLDNGLTVLLLERHHSPTVACQIAFKVGSNNERPGVTGSAHMLEHMMFKGTKTIGTNNFEAEVPLMQEIDRLANLLLNERLKGEEANQEQIEEWQAKIHELQERQREFIVSEELTTLYKRNGASDLNAYTSSDYTNYICKLPANKLELWCWLEADRIAHPVFREFYAEKEVVHEERRMRVDTSPGGALWEVFNSTIYHAHPYGWMTIGWPSDIANYRRETMEEFFTQYYAPNNAVIVWVGSFDTQEALKLIEKYFGPIPSQPEPPAVVTQEPPQNGERRVELKFEANPSLLMGWPTVAIDNKDQAVLEVLQGILSDGRTSRLYRRMRERNPLVSDVEAYAMPSEYPGIFILAADPLQTSTLEEVEAVLREEVAKLAEEPVSEWELDRVKNQLQAEYVQKLESNYMLAKDLAEFECKADWRVLAENDRRRQEVTAEDIQRVAKTYLVPEHLTVARLVPKPGSQEQSRSE
jgi:predicted Zn-dependent peptidase